jgi:multicomponent Na+:H+ antiporter subunit D
MSHWIAAPVLGFVLSGVVLWCLRGQRWVRGLGLLSMTIQFAFALYVLTRLADGELFVSQMGGWAAPFGITWVLDLFSGLMLAVCCFVAWVSLIYGLGFPAWRGAVGAQAQVFVHFLMAGVSLAFVTGDVFNLFVAFEVMLMSSFALVVFSSSRDWRSSATQYVLLNLLSSMFFLVGAGLIYGAYGSLNFAHLGQLIAGDPSPERLFFPAILVLLGFAVKSAVFPFFGWLPASYPQLHAPVAALFAGLLTKVGIYAAVRFASISMGESFAAIQWIVAIVAGLTMVTGVLAAASRYHTKQILSFHIISQVGYMVMGLAVFTVSSAAAVVFYICHHIVAKANLFFVQGLVEAHFGTDDLGSQGGLARLKPLWAVCFLSSALALAGLPPFSGFFAKYVIVKAAFAEERYVLVTAALFTGLMTVYSMFKIWNETFIGAPSVSIPTPGGQWRSGEVAIVLMGLFSLAMGLAFPWFYPLFEAAGTQLLRPDKYIEAVMGVAR